MKWLRIFLGLVLMLASVAGHSQGTARFVGVGQAVIVGGDSAAAERLARQAARTQGLTRAMESYVAGGQVDRHSYNLKKGEILRQGESFIRSESVLAHDVRDVILKLSLAIDVDMTALGRAMGEQGMVTRQQAQSKQRHKPTVVVIVAEEISGGLNSFPYSAGVIQDKMLAAGYPLVDQTAAARSAKHDQAVQAVLNNNVKAARALALQFDAGLMVTGRAVVQQSGIKGGGMTSYGANIALSAVAADSGRVLATASASGSYPHVNAMVGSRLAVEDATAKAMTELLDKLGRQDQQLGVALRMTVSGINYQQLAILKKILHKEFPQVMDIDTRGFSGTIARLDVVLEGRVTDFSEALAMKNFGGFRLKVLSQSSEKLDTTLVKK